MRKDVVEEAGERCGPTGTSGQPAVQADREHPREVGSLAVENVETVLEIGEELVAAVESRRGGKPHVVGIERVGYNQLWATRAIEPVGQLVGVAVGRIEESLILHDDAERVWGATTLVEAERPRADHLGVNADRFANMRELVFPGKILVLDPFQAVRGDFPVSLLHRHDDVGMARHGGRYAKHG
jgi:hypothetical protein